MAINCGPSFGLCALRITALDDLGNVQAGSNNVYVTDQQVSLAFTPNIDEGETFSQRNGCGCSIARFKAEDIFNWWEFTFTDGAFEPDLINILLGSTGIVDGANRVGLHWPESLDCDELKPIVAIEAWTQHIVGSKRDSQYPYIHWVWPASKWQMGDNTAEEDFMNPVLNGVSLSNPLWGSGPFSDGPPDGSDVGQEGAAWLTDDLPPVAVCGLTTISPGS